MTKFEEKLEILPIKIIQHPVGDTKYYAAVHVKSLIAQADEEFQELKSKIDWLNNLLDERNEEVLEKVRKMNEDLPVVPEFVGLGISEDIQLNTVVADVLTTVITSDDKDLKEYGLWIKENLVTYVIARTLGYQVEKPQLFYLKHIDMSKSDAHLNWYLAKGTDNVLIHQGIKKGKSPKLKCILKLTQQEIDSMKTGSYEQIEVTE